jgi:hypothetical protein
MDQLILAADDALLTAKRSGRNKIVVARSNQPADHPALQADKAPEQESAPETDQRLTP